MQKNNERIATYVRGLKGHLLDKMTLHPLLTLDHFDKWAVDFVGPITSIAQCTGMHYIIIAIEYLTCWVEVASVKYYSVDTTTYIFLECFINIWMPPSNYD